MSSHYDKLASCTPISDAELKEAMDFWRDLASKLDALGQRFAFSTQEARRMFHICREMKEARSLE